MSKQANIFRSIIFCISILLAGVSPALAQDNALSKGIQASDEVSGYVFDMKGCQRKRKALICTGRLTSPYGNVSLIAYSEDTSLTDESGDRYIAESVYYGVAYNTIYTLVKDVPIKVTITFRNIPDIGKSIPLITVGTRFTGVFQLKNVNISN